MAKYPNNFFAPVRAYIQGRSLPAPQANVHHFLSAIDVLPYYASAQELESYLGYDAHPLRDDITCAIAGINYPQIPGSYAYPFGNGSFEVYGSPEGAMVRSVPNGTARPYEHRLRHYLEPQTSLSFGWGSCFYDLTTHPHRHIVDAWMPNVRFPDCSVQANFLARYQLQHPYGFKPLSAANIASIVNAATAHFSLVGAIRQAIAGRIDNDLDGALDFLANLVEDRSQVHITQSFFFLPGTWHVKDLAGNVLYQGIFARDFAALDVARQQSLRAVGSLSTAVRFARHALGDH